MFRGCRYKMFDFTNVCSISTVILNLYTNKKQNSFLIFFFEVEIVPNVGRNFLLLPSIYKLVVTGYKLQPA